MTLEQFFQKHPVAAVAFSGGCDSAYLLYEASRYGKQIHAFYMCSPFQPLFEQEDARRFCQQYRISLTILQYDVCSNPDIIKNDSQRCYYCKHSLFSKLKEAASKQGFPILLDGTNASDSPADRPGMRALKELDVLSPLQLCNLTKVEIRKRSLEHHLFTSNKPSYSCLATRIPMGTIIARPVLEKIEQCENIVFKLGFSDFRVRIYENAARLQLPLEQFPLALEKRQLITEAFLPYFTEVFLDLQPR